MLIPPPPAACQILETDSIGCVLPAAQRPFMDPLSLDCRIIDGEYSFTLRCRINIGKQDRWIKGPKPVVNYSRYHHPKKKKAIKKKKT